MVFYYWLQSTFTGKRAIANTFFLALLETYNFYVTLLHLALTLRVENNLRFKGSGHWSFLLMRTVSEEIVRFWRRSLCPTKFIFGIGMNFNVLFLLRPVIIVLRRHYLAIHLIDFAFFIKN